MRGAFTRNFSLCLTMRFARVGDDCIRLRWHFPLATPYKILTLITPSKGASHVIYVMCSSYLPMYPTLSFRLGFRTHLLFLPASTPFTTSAWSPFYRFLLSTPSQRRYTSNMKPTCCHLVALAYHSVDICPGLQPRPP